MHQKKRGVATSTSTTPTTDSTPDPLSTTVLVSDLQGINATLAEFEQAFGKAGQIISSYFHGNDVLLTFRTRRQAERAVARYHGGLLENRPIRVTLQPGALPGAAAAGAAAAGAVAADAGRERTKGMQASFLDTLNTYIVYAPKKRGVNISPPISVMATAVIDIPWVAEHQCEFAGFSTGPPTATTEQLNNQVCE